MQQRKKPNRPYQIKKTGIKHRYIDSQILVIHAAIADKLIQHPELIEQVLQQLEQRKELGRINYSQYITWFSILEQINTPKIFKQAILEDSPKMRKFRRNTPLVNILTEEERQNALSTGALGEISDINNLIL